MQNVPGIVIDDFYSDPDRVRDWALQQEFTREGEGAWPGKRTKPLDILDPYFYQQFVNKVFSIFMPVEHDIDARVQTMFQLIPNFEDDPKSPKNLGWIHDDDDTLFVYNKNSYVNRLGAYIGLQLMENYSPDFIYKKYKSQQLEFCKHLGVEPSSTVLFGIAPQDKYVEYDRGGGSPDAELNRLSFHKFLPMSIEEFAQCIKQE